MNKHVDAIVIGAGAGGGVIAKELACSGMKTVLFERGGCGAHGPPSIPNSNAAQFSAL